MAGPTVSNTNTQANQVFDDGGNLKGETSDKSLFATSLGAGDFVQNGGTSKQISDSNSLLIFVTISLFSAIFIFKKQLAYSIKKPYAVGTTSPNYLADAQKQIIFAVDQKTDGTVVLYFQGKEHKVSKPELDSESDQFIDRLMELVRPDIKEIDYDNLRDEKIRFSAPLSKLVTRLGFVGVKRDLFFPRTSKNRVLFRRYVTQQDLASMGLTTNQILNEFIDFQRPVLPQ